MQLTCATTHVNIYVTEVYNSCDIKTHAAFEYECQCLTENDTPASPLRAFSAYTRAHSTRTLPQCGHMSVGAESASALVAASGAIVPAAPGASGTVP
jgi:hypothetical protein